MLRGKQIKNYSYMWTTAMQKSYRYAEKDQNTDKIKFGLLEL